MIKKQLDFCEEGRVNFPIVEYAHIIGKNTAEFTMFDMMGFMNWWMKKRREEK